MIWAILIALAVLLMMLLPGWIKTEKKNPNSPFRDTSGDIVESIIDVFVDD